MTDQQLIGIWCCLFECAGEEKGSSLPLTLINFEQGSTVDLTTFSLVMASVRIQIKEIGYAQSINHNHQSKGTIS